VRDASAARQCQRRQRSDPAAHQLNSIAVTRCCGPGRDLLMVVNVELV
jgi:hypothetical protein